MIYKCVKGAQVKKLGIKTCDLALPCPNSKVDARLLVLVHVVLELRLAKLVEGDDDQGDEDVDEEERKDDEEDDVEDALLSSEPRDGAFIFISGRHGVL